MPTTEARCVSHHSLVSLSKQEATTASHATRVKADIQSLLTTKSKKVKTSTRSCTKTPPPFEFTRIAGADAKNVNGDNAAIHPGAGTPKPNAALEPVVALAEAAVNEKSVRKMHPKHHEMQLLCKMKSHILSP